MEVEKYLKTIMDAGYEGSVVESGETISLQFWRKQEDAIPVRLIEELADGDTDYSASYTLKKLVKWWRKSNGKLSDEE